MHFWGDEGVDWKGINDAAEYIAKFCKRWGKIGVRDYKEKFGRVTVYLSFGWHQLHCITHPGYVYNQYPKWLWHLDCVYLSKIIQPLNRIVIPWQIFIYRLAYKKALKKWPHLREEIFAGCDYEHLLLHLHDKPTFDDITTMLTEIHCLRPVLIKKKLSLETWDKVCKWLQLKRYTKL